MDLLRLLSSLLIMVLVIMMDRLTTGLLMMDHHITDLLMMDLLMMALLTMDLPTTVLRSTTGAT